MSEHQPDTTGVVWPRFRPGRASVLLGLAGFLTALLAVETATCPAFPAASAETPGRLRVLAYNIHHGEGTDGKVDLERIARVIRDARPDLVALNEVDRGVKRTNQIDQPKELARLTQMQVIFERNIVYQGGDYGNAVLSRLPIKRHQNHALPSFYKGEQRGVLEVEVEPPGGKETILFLATHLDYRPDDKERQASVKKIEELLGDGPGDLGDRSGRPVLLAGDLNANPDSEVLKLFRRTWTVAASREKTLTYPSKEPTKQIDYVLFRPAGRWKAIEVRAIDEPVASDHRPVLAVLELVGGK